MNISSLFREHGTAVKLGLAVTFLAAVAWTEAAIFDSVEADKGCYPVKGEWSARMQDRNPENTSFYLRTNQGCRIGYEKK